MEYEFQKYVANIDNIKIKLEEYGVAIIPNVLNNEECNKINDGIWDFFEHLTKEWKDNIPIDRNNVKSWNGLFHLCPF